MALSNKDPQEIKAGLGTWLASRIPGASDVSIDKLDVPSASGMSNLTVLFDASYDLDGQRHAEQLVARVAPEGPAVFMDYDLEREFKVMQALAEHTDVPVPAMRWVENDPEVLGAPFLVMGRAHGRVPSDDPPFTAAGWVLDELDDAGRLHLCENSLEALAKIHAADLDALDLTFLVPEGQTVLDADFAQWRRIFDWARDGGPNPTVEAGLAWLEEHRPAEEPAPVLLWGDARVGNMLFGEDLSVQAVLDWEMVGVGQPEADVAWWLFILRHHTEGIGVPVPSGIPTPEVLIGIYEGATGRTLKNLDYYEVWAAVRLAIIMHRAGNLMIELGLLPKDAAMPLNNPASQLLAGLIGAPAPSGDAQSFIGNR